MIDEKKTNEDKAKGTGRGQPLRAKAGKDQVAYWKSRLKKRTYRKGKELVEISDWQVRMKHAGKDGWFNLHTLNADSAAGKARDIYRLLVANGWEAVNEQYKPKPKEFSESPTLGEFFQAVEKNVAFNPKTFASYCRRFRTIVSDIFGIDAPTKEKFCFKKSVRWRERVEAVELSKITPKKIEQWRRDFIATAGGNQLRVKENTHSADSAIRCARALFGKQVKRQLADFPFPSPLPFEGVPVAQLRNPYRSRIDKDALIQAAFDDLRTAQPEPFKIFLLCLMVGLRRNEVDKLKWDSIDWSRGTIAIEAHAEFSAKTDGSEAVLEVDPNLLTTLRPFCPADRSGYVIKSKVGAKPRATYTHYRANFHFVALIDWLRANGVNTRCPIHTLRKECGRMVTEVSGIYAASRQLRHRDVTTTARYYADDRRAIFPKLPTALIASVPAIPPAPELGPSDSKPDSQTDRGVQGVSSAPSASSCGEFGKAA